MNLSDLIALSPFLVLITASVVVMLAIAIRRSHALAFGLTHTGLLLSFAAVCVLAGLPPREVTPLLIVDRFALFFIGLILLSAVGVASFSYSYLNLHQGHREEFYLLLLIATLGCAVLASSMHFASFFLGIELLSISLYSLIAYLRHSNRGVEAGLKYLILAAVSSACILFGMALVYAATGSLALKAVAMPVSGYGVYVLAGACMIMVGVGFKLALVPFHFWTPDVYEGAPAPVTAFIASASKAAVFALVLRMAAGINTQSHPSLIAIMTITAVSSMFAGNLLAMFQTNVKRILAYSSISHLGYLLIPVIAGGMLAEKAALFSVAIYCITSLGVFGVIALLSTKDRDADRLEDYRGLAWKRPLLACVFTIALFSLAGLPVTAGFIAKFYLAAAGVSSGLWFLMIALAINSVLGLFYYLRIVIALFTPSKDEQLPLPAIARLGITVLASIMLLLLWVGVYPAPVLAVIESAARSLR